MKLFKRDAGGREVRSNTDPRWRRDAPYYTQFVIAGERHTLNSSKLARPGDYELALADFRRRRQDLKLAHTQHNRAAIDLILGRRPADAVAWAPVGPYLARLESLALYKPRASSRRAAAQALRRLLALAHDLATPAAADALTFEALTPDALRKWFTLREAAAMAHADPAKQDSALRSANSEIMSALSVLTHSERVRESGITGQLPDEKALLDVVRKRTFPVGAPVLEIPGAAVLEATWQSWLQLPRNDFIAAGLALAFGVRASEAAEAAPDWLAVIEGFRILRIPVRTKNGTLQATVKGLNPFCDLLLARCQREGWLTGPYLMDGTETERGDQVFRRISTWLAGLGWRTRKKEHALRAFAACQVWMRYNDVLATRDFCRHASIATTERNYGYFVRQFRPEDPASMRLLDRPVGWSRETTDFVPILLTAAG